MPPAADPSVPLSTKATRLAWLIVALLWPVALLNYLDRLMITSMRDPIVAEIHLTDAQFGMLSSVFLWCYGILSPFGGFLADRFSRRWVILLSLVIWSAVTWLTGHLSSFEGLLWARALMGASEACYLPAALALITDYHRGQTRSLATAVHGSGIYMGAALGGIGGFLAEWVGWRGGFTMLGVIGILYAFVLIFFLKDCPRTAAPSATALPPSPARIGAAFRELLSLPAFHVLLLVNALVSLANWAAYGWLPTYFREHFNLSLGEAGISATAYLQVASFVAIIIGGIWADRWCRKSPRGRTWVPAIGYAIAAPALFLIGSTDIFALAIFGVLLFGIGRGFYDSNLMPILRQMGGERYAATGYGFLNCIGCLVGGVMIYVGGAMRDAHFSLSTVFQFCAGALLITSILLFFLKPKARLD